MKNAFLTLTAGIALCMVTAAAAAPTAGEHMLQLGGGVFMHQGSADTGTAQGEFNYSYMFAPHWSVGFQQLASYSLNDPIEDVWTGSTAATIDYYPWSQNRDVRLQPFIGAFAGIGYSDVDLTGAVGPTVGARYFMSDNLFFSGQWHYLFYTHKLDAGNETTDRDSGTMSFTVGIGFTWGGD